MARTLQLHVRRAVAVAVLLPMLVLAQLAPAHAATIQDPAITESTGLAYDGARGTYWTANRSETPGTIYAIAPDGSTVGTITMPIQPQSIEAVSMRNGALYVADIGDSDRNRQSISIYWTNAITYGFESPTHHWELIYPDGPHDAKAFAISPNGNIYVITFGDPGGIYLAYAPAVQSGQVWLERVADTPSYVTDMTFYDNLSLAVRTYNSVLVLDSMNGYTVSAAAPIPAQPAGESMTLSSDGMNLVLGSIGQGSELLHVDTPYQIEDIPEPQSSPPALDSTPNPQESPTETETPEDQSPEPEEPAPNGDGRRVNSTTTIISLAAAALLSIGAGVVVYRRSG